MSSTLGSLFCGSSTLRSVDEKGYISLFCRSRRSETSYESLSDYPHLDHEASNCSTHSESKQMEQLSVSQKPSMKTALPPSSVTTIPKELSSTSPSYLVSEDIALAWIDMGSQTASSLSTLSKGCPIASPCQSVVRPLSMSTRLNRMEITDDDNRFSSAFFSRSSYATGFKQSCNDIPVKFVPNSKGEFLGNFLSIRSSSSAASIWPTRGNVTVTTSQRQTRLDPLRPDTTAQTSIPSPPPLISFNRRFRVCFGVMSDWQSAVDPKTGRTYYYNAITRETQWRKPVELATEEERHEMEEKERKQREFFSAMEANIIKSIASGNLTSKKIPTIERKESIQPTRPRIVRTISSMDEGTLKDMIKRTPSTRNLMKQSARGANEMSTLEMIEELEMEQSSYDFGNTSLSMFHESSADLGAPASEVMALRALARISKEMVTVSEHGEDDELEYSMSERFDTSIQDFSLDLSDSLELSSQDFMLQEKSSARARGDASFMDSLVFSPDLVDKKSAPNKLQMGEIVSSPGAPTTKTAASDDADDSDEELDLRSSLLSKPPLVKRNTCGTLYVESTMSAPDKDATMKCICGVFRAHILGAEREDQDIGEKYDYTRDKFRLFNDREAERSRVLPVDEEMSLEDLSLTETEKGIPNLDEITCFYRNVFTRAQMETDCIIMSLIYVERLIKVTDGALRPRRSNWRSLLLSCMILSSKVWDDLSMWNSDFSQLCPAGIRLTVTRVNELELAILKALGYKVKVQASEYAKYYFLLRSMLIKSGLGGDDLQKMNRLDVEDAKRLEQVSTNFQNLAATKRRARLQDSLRSKSMGDAEKQKMRSNKVGASLEHMVKM